MPVVYHLYTSNTYPVDTDDANHLFMTSLIGNEVTLSKGQGQPYFAVTASDRFGNESIPLALNHAPQMNIPVLNKGSKLKLPELNENSSILICNSMGETVSQTSYQKEISLTWLSEGFYLVYALDKNGEKTLLGTILK